MTASSMMAGLSGIGRDLKRGGYSRPVFSPAELELREWFVGEAQRLRLDVETDRNGIIWAWWDTPGRARENAVATGSHLDSVPGGGAFDGPLGVVSALAAVESMQASGCRPNRPVVIIVFPEEEGSRYGLPCLGSGLMAGTVSADRALALKDENGDTLADLFGRNGIEPHRVGPDPKAMERIGAFVELHVEQGRGLVDLSEPVAIGHSIIGHGRWKLRFEGQGNHAGTTLMPDRRDPMIPAAQTILAVQEAARAVPGARATVGKVIPVPGGSNVIASAVDVWLDVRHADESALQPLVDEITARAHGLAGTAACHSSVSRESYSPTATFDADLIQRFTKVLPSAPLLDTGAGHDAGVLAPFTPSAMLFVRNPSGISHSPEEYAEDADVDAGAHALALILMDLASA
ncbi:MULTISPECIES: allantoate amidohydrolase [unclassified Streptomyces]|uniref:allantoate amidohydrolase n=1 Tax=unclassified Streptomyces TaxID=2593676 RepID=UPI002258D16E|nr:MULTISPECIES: allantoate amidohydrolase [unclassified Streptomyces]MCX5336365.1 allantoate amidohydrolase [Streptomyces sp. NBC_00140]MCX5367087.1 allantoate amidohydrolase [Streptomyces sp. NBC_00124]